MAASTSDTQRHYLSILLIGMLTGLLALIPGVGWLLGFAAFALAWRYARRRQFVPDLLLTLLLWLLVRALALQLAVTAP